MKDSELSALDMEDQEDTMELDAEAMASLVSLINTDDGAIPSPEELEARMREAWSLPEIDIARALSDTEFVADRSRRIRAEFDEAEDWSDDQWPLATAMIRHCRAAVAPATPPKTRTAAIRWIFERGKQDSKGFDFQLCCASLGARPYVIQTMVHNRWFANNITLHEPIPFMADPLHTSLIAEAYVHAFQFGGEILATIWRRPSINISELREAMPSEADDAVFHDSYNRLTKAGLIGERVGRVYVTGRSSAYLRQRRSSFSRTFMDPQ